MGSNAQSAIWRAGTVNGSGAEPSGSGSDIIEFNTGSLINDQGHILQTKFNITSSVAVNELPGAVDKLQDTGVQGIIIYVTGSINNPQGDGSDPAQKFKEWMLEDKTINVTNKVFPKGRFGLRLNDFTALNLTPTADRGYILSSVEFIRDGETKGKLQFVATLRFNGIIGSPNGSGQYLW